MTIRRIDTLSDSEIKLVARHMADSDEPCVHGFEAGSTQAAIFETAYRARRRELEQVGA